MNISSMTAPDTQILRKIEQLTSGVPASDGDGVQLTRLIGTSAIDMVDPFLLLDAFGSDRPGDYMGGFPNHPHRGFETVTYMLDGRMRHKDNAGHEGVIGPGDVQWMTAGRGAVHSEMPEQENGLLQGFQLWVNLPAAQKMIAPAYQEYASADIPVEQTDDGCSIKVIAGTTDKGTIGAVANLATETLYFDVRLEAGAKFSQYIPSGHNTFMYVIDGDVQAGGMNTELSSGSLGVFGEGDRVEITSAKSASRFLVVAGKGLNEPVARGGPFVMNTKQEVLRAFEDYRQGRF